MRRFGRWAFNILSALSLLLFGSTVGVWVRSYWRGDDLSCVQETFYFPAEDRITKRPDAGGWAWRDVTGTRLDHLTLRSSGGVWELGLRVGRTEYDSPAGALAPDVPPPQNLSRVRFYHWEAARGSGFSGPTESLGFGFSWYQLPLAGVQGAHGTYQHRRLAAPYWFTAMALAALPLIQLRRRLLRRRRERRLRQGQCVACGYDLRATPDRCPECGHVRAAIKD